MNGIGFGVRAFLRDLRAGELSVLLASIIVAVTSMTAVGFFTDRVGTAIRAQAGAVLAGDLELRAAEPLDATFLQDAQQLGLEVAEAISFPTMVLAGDSNALSNVRAVSNQYPLRGDVLVADQLFGEKVIAKVIPQPGTAWADPGLMARLGVDVGAEITVGASSLRITRVVEHQPGQGMGAAAVLAPALLVNLADLEAFAVVKPGSRVTYRQLFAGSASTISKWREILKPQLGDSIRMRGLEDAGAQINAAIDRAQRFLTLASLVTVILAAVATAMAARRYAQRHLDTVALMKSMGATQRFIQRSTLSQLLIIIVITALAGSLLGYAAQSVLVIIVGDFLDFELPSPALTAGLLGLLTSATITIGFALPHLMKLKTTPPIRVLRHDLPAPGLSAGLTYSAALAALWMMVWIMVRDVTLVVSIAVGLILVAVLAVAAGWILVRGLSQFRGAAGVAWRYGLANISRRGSESVAQIVAFALGLMVLLLLTLVRTELLDEWRASLPEDAPNYFMINIDPQDWPGIAEYFNRTIGSKPEFLPFIRGRITRINGESIDDYVFADARGASFVRQETNLTWGAQLPDSNKLVAGQWWSGTLNDSIEVSLDAGIAGNLGVGLGDRMGFSIGGEEFDAQVTSLRQVQWDSMRPNFYLMLSPGLASELPQTYISSLFVPPERRGILTDFIRDYPGVTLLNLGAVLNQIRMIIDRASMAVQYVFLFTLLAGVMVLLAAIGATRDERRFESAILRTLGASRSTIMQGIAVEFIVLGALAGILASVGAGVIAWLLAVRVFDLDYTFNGWLLLAGWFAGSAIVGVTGIIATRSAVNEAPVAVLRET